MTRLRVRMTVLATLVATALGLAAMAPPGVADSGSGTAEPQALPVPWTYYTLQLNLCNSGAAPCYDQNQGRSVAEGIGLIEDKRPDLVTLNEVCWNDVHNDLYPVMRDLWPGEYVFAVFFPAYYPYDDGVWPPDPKTCRNGYEYGSGIIGRTFTDIDGDPPSVGRYHDFYPERLQNPGAGEWRSWGCVDVADTLWACTTHLDADDELWAMDQCSYLMNEKLPALQAQWGYLPSIVGGDLNMEYPFVQGCVPDNWWRKGDDDVQHIMYTDDFSFVFSERIEMRYTDHPAWLVAAATPGSMAR
jgi:hypothetical protein